MINLKKQLKEGKNLHGCWVNLGSYVSAEIMGNIGFEWLLIDMEHGAGDEATLYHQLQALSNSSSFPIVRVDSINKAKVQRILDFGAAGIMFPQIQTPEEARFAINSMYYPPKGIRGMAKMVRATGFGNKFDEYFSSLEEKLLGVIQIETLKALENVDEIAAIEGVDVLFVGPSDLSMSMGFFNELKHPQYQNAIQKVADAALKHQKSAGVLIFDVAEYEMYFNLGYQFIAQGADSSFIQKGATKTLNLLREKSGSLRR